MIAYAAGTGISSNLTYFSTFITGVGGLAKSAITVLIALAVVVLFWGIVKYIWGGADDTAQAKNLMIWSVVAIAVMISIWGLVGLLQQVFLGGNAGTTPEAPGLPAMESGADVDFGTDE